MATDPVRDAGAPRDPIEDDIAEALADPELVASLDEFEDELRRGVLVTYSTEEVMEHLGLRS